MRQNSSENNHSDKLLRTFFDCAPMMMGFVDVSDDSIILGTVNQVAAEFLGHDQSFIKGKSSLELGMDQERIDGWIKFYREAEKSREHVFFDYWLEGPEGLKHFSAIVCFVEYAESGLPRFSFIIQDTTATKMTQQALEQQENFLETVLDNIPDMIFVKEAESLRFLKFNKAGEDLIGFNRDELIGKNDYDLFPKNQADHFTTYDREMFKNRKVVEIPEEPIETRYKGVRTLHTKKIPLYDAEGKPLYLVGISEDITEKLLTEEIKNKMYHEQVARLEVEKLLEARDEFISIASHELKSPLSSLKLQAQMLRRNIALGKEDAYSPEKINQMLELTEKQVQRLDRLVNDMLDVSRIRTGKLAIDRTKVNLFDLILDVMNRMKTQFLQLECGLPTFRYSSDKVIGMWDQMRIEQVLVNLLTNAIRYGKNRPVEIRLSQTKEHAQFSVHDQGIGIAEGQMEKIFERFVRAINPSEVSGLGLGLFISLQIVEAHGGKMWVESKVDVGSTFYVQLPLNPPIR